MAERSRDLESSLVVVVVVVVIGGDCFECECGGINHAWRRRKTRKEEGAREGKLRPSLI